MKENTPYIDPENRPKKGKKSKIGDYINSPEDPYLDPNYDINEIPYEEQAKTDSNDSITPDKEDLDLIIL